jgi:ubiquinone/menaquinone biosynthesis C-methylase UbiE
VTVPGWTAVADAIAVGPGMRLLDVGCGDGGFLAVARELGAEVSGLDADPAAVARARRAVPGADVREGFMEDLPWPDAHFDAVAGFNALQYARDIDLALRETLRVLAPDGRLAVCKWGRPQDNELFRLAVAIGAGAPGALQARDPVEEAMSRAGLKVHDRGDLPLELEVADLAALAGATGAVDARALAEQASPYRRPDGSYRFSATLAYVVAAAQ